MYIKWVIRRHKNEELANISFYDAYLVQSYKNEAGEPRQRTLCYLGNLRQIDNTFPVVERALFYVRMEEILLRNLPKELQNPEERIKLYQGISAVAAPPTREEISQGEQFHRLWHEHYWKMLQEAVDNVPPDIMTFFQVQEQILDSVDAPSKEAETAYKNTVRPEIPIDHITLIGQINSKKP